MIEHVLRWDTSLFTRINTDWQSALFDAVMPVLSYTPFLWGIVFAVLAFALTRAYTASDSRAALRGVALSLLLLGICVGATELGTATAKKVVGRVRPYQSLPQARYVDDDTGWVRNPADFIPKKQRGSSFFSGHAANSMAVATCAAILVPPLSPYVYILPFAVGYSRLYLGKHYPTDVACGWLFGWLVTSCLARYGKRRLAL